MKLIITKTLIWLYLKTHKNALYTDVYIEKKVKWLKSKKDIDKIFVYIAEVFNEKLESIQLLFEV